MAKKLRGRKKGRSKLKRKQEPMLFGFTAREVSNIASGGRRWGKRYGTKVRKAGTKAGRQ